jgi:hypothetical protein
MRAAASLASVMRRLGDGEGALALLRERARAVAPLKDKNDPEAHLALAGYAFALKAEGFAREGLRLLKGAVETLLKRHGEDHPLLADAVARFASLRRRVAEEARDG